MYDCLRLVLKSARSSVWPASPALQFKRPLTAVSIIASPTRPISRLHALEGFAYVSELTTSSPFSIPSFVNMSSHTGEGPWVLGAQQGGQFLLSG